MVQLKSLVVTASKVDQYLNCPRSASAQGSSLSRQIDYESDQDSAANHGRKLHKCIEVLTRDGLSSAEETARQLGVLSEFNNLDFGLINSVLDNAINSVQLVDILHQQSYAIDFDGNSRKIKSYDDISIADAVVGTADLVVEGKEAVIVIDWKTGKQSVSAVNNGQLRMLAQMASSGKKCDVIICNPVLKQSSAWTIPQNDNVLKQILEKQQKQSAGFHCKWCPHKMNCESFGGMIEATENALAEVLGRPIVNAHASGANQNDA